VSDPDWIEQTERFLNDRLPETVTVACIMRDIREQQSRIASLERTQITPELREMARGLLMELETRPAYFDMADVTKFLESFLSATEPKDEMPKV